MPLFLIRLFLRIVARNREVYLLKIITLSIAFASSTLVVLFTMTEFGYDRFHRDASSVFRVIRKNTSELHNGNRLSNKIPVQVYNTLTLLSPDSIAVARLSIMDGLGVWGDQKHLYSGAVHAADPTITDIFSFKILHGSIANFSADGHRAVLSSSLAESLFGNAKASGKRISIRSLDDTLSFEVVAVYEDFPVNSHEDFNLFISFDVHAVEELGFNPAESGIYGRVVFSGIADFEQRIRSRIVEKDLEYIFQPVPEIYFGPRVLGEDARHGDRYSILILFSLTGLIFFLALTSYVNLTTLTLPYRSKEIAIRKLAGTNQFDLFFIFFRESLAVVLISFLFGVLLLLLAAEGIESSLSIDLIGLLLNSRVALLAIVAVILLILTVSPLFLALRFINASPNRLLSTDTITFPRLKRTIAVLQLGISIFLIVASLVIKRQINYSLLKEPGRNYDEVVYLSYPDDLTKEGLMRTRNGWQTYHPNIVDVIALSQLPDRITRKDVNSPFFSLSVDPFFPDFFKLNMIRGTWFRPNTADSFVVLNQRGLRQIAAGHDRNIIGVIEDINSQLNQPEKPIKFRLEETSRYNYVCVRILEVDIRRTIHFLSDYFNGAQINILNKRYDAWINYQDRLNSISNLLGIISALLACLAIYGLSVSIVRDKLKQIAVHKIYGAGSHNIAFLLAREFIKEAFLAIAIFGPVTYIFVSEFLRNFVYATHFEWMDPVLPLVYCILVISMLCGVQAFKLNRSNLASVLRG